MSAIIEEGIDYGNRSFTPESINSDKFSMTDVIISHYENRLNESTATKALNASKQGVPPVFTQEEQLYLSKKSSHDSEITVITPSPTITLKKGNTEINIKNAAALVQRMEEKYPNGMSEDSREDVLRQPFIEASIEEGLKNIPTVIPSVKTVNSNAYEIRESIIEKSIDIVKYSTIDSKCDTDTMVNKILDVASKLYEFVENKRNRR